jgi:hypothetical protein
MDYLKIAIPAHENSCIISSPGIGKTAIIKQACNELGCGLILSHPATHNPTHYSGLGYPDETKEFAKFLPYGQLAEAMKVDKLTVWFFDDFGQATYAVQSAAMQLFWGGEINGKKISDHVVFIAATNRREDKANVLGILEPVKSRFRLINLTPDNKDWLQWADKNDMPSELTAFINWQPNFLFDFKPTFDLQNSPNPRNLEKVGRGMKTGYPIEMEHEIFAGDCGDVFATGFCAFLKICRAMVSPMQILLDPSKYVTPVGKEGIAIHYALARALAIKAEQKHMKNISVIASKLPPEFATLMMSIIEKTKPELMETGGYVSWAVANGKNRI